MKLVLGKKIEFNYSLWAVVGVNLSDRLNDELRDNLLYSLGISLWGSFRLT